MVRAAEPPQPAAMGLAAQDAAAEGYRVGGSTARPTEAAVVSSAAVVRVTCPPGASAGAPIQVEHQGCSFNVTVPAGVAAGQAFNVQLPSSHGASPVVFAQPVLQAHF